MSSGGENIMLILSSPSGVGKTTLTKNTAKIQFFKISVSHTTEKPRSNEVDGVDYNFVSQSEFEDLIKRENFMNMQKYLKIIMERLKAK